MEMPLFFRNAACDVYFVHVMYDRSPLLSLTAQPPLLRLFTSGPMGGSQTQRV